MYTLLKPLSVRQELLKRKIPIFTIQEFERLFNNPKSKTKYFLENMAKKELFLRLKKGLYAIKTDLPSEEVIANRLYKPSYLSFEYVLAYYNILPEMPYTITSATTKPTRIFTIAEKTFIFSTIKNEAYTGYIALKRGGQLILIAEPEKALVDYLYFVSLNKKPKNDRLDIKSLNKGKILKYTKLYN